MDARQVQTRTHVRIGLTSIRLQTICSQFLMKLSVPSHQNMTGYFSWIVICEITNFQILLVILRMFLIH